MSVKTSLWFLAYNMRAFSRVALSGVWARELSGALTVAVARQRAEKGMLSGGKHERDRRVAVIGGAQFSRCQWWHNVCALYSFYARAKCGQVTFFCALTCKQAIKSRLHRMLFLFKNWSLLKYPCSFLLEHLILFFLFSCLLGWRYQIFQLRTAYQIKFKSIKLDYSFLFNDTLQASRLTLHWKWLLYLI